MHVLLGLLAKANVLVHVDADRSDSLLLVIMFVQSSGFPDAWLARNAFAYRSGALPAPPVDPVICETSGVVPSSSH